MVYHLDFAPQADFLVSIGTDSSIRLWAVPTLPSGSSSTSDAKELGARLLSHTAARPSSDPSQPAFAAIESIPQLARFREKLDSNGGSNKHALFSPDGETLATCGSDLHIKLWSVPALELKVCRFPAQPRSLAASSPDHQPTLTLRGTTSHALSRAEHSAGLARARSPLRDPTPLLLPRWVHAGLVLARRERAPLVRVRALAYRRPQRRPPRQE